MSKTKKILIFGVTALFIVFVALVLTIPSLAKSFFYPQSNRLPTIVSMSTEQLLNQLQLVLETNAPLVAQSLEPGLSDEKISELESQGGFRLSKELKALYRWHNGMATNSPIGLVPGQRFIPLDEFVRQKTLMCQQADSETFIQGFVYKIFAGYRKNWVQVMDDGAGDGYFYDPDRADGAFFFHFTEVGYYRWFPSLNNFLAGTIECYEKKVFKISADGKKFEQDSEQAETIWNRLSKNSEEAS